MPYDEAATVRRETAARKKMECVIAPDSGLASSAASDAAGGVPRGDREVPARRVAELTAPDGWLAVRGLFWLHEGANTAGSDPASEIRLPARAPKRLGVFTLTDGR